MGYKGRQPAKSSSQAANNLGYYSAEKTTKQKNFRQKNADEGKNFAESAVFRTSSCRRS
jgi:hypothetical protein